MAFCPVVQHGAGYCAEILEHELKFKSCRLDNDVWFKAATKEDGTPYYKYILVYTNDLLL